MTDHEPVSVMPKTRGYQQEMLEESLKRNIIIALDTGAGKTHIAILRIKIEAEREHKKVSWFLAPNVALCIQQQKAIASSLPVAVGLISGALRPDQWKDGEIWRKIVQDYRIIVSTPQVLLDAMRHGFIKIDSDIGIIVFDEAHHAGAKHPYNLIMLEHYFRLTKSSERPKILGLTASPMLVKGDNVSNAFQTLEANLDSTILAPRRNREELSMHVHRPVFTILTYPPNEDSSFSTNVASLEHVCDSLLIDEDPYIVTLRRKLSILAYGTPDYARADQNLSLAIKNKDTYTQKALRDFHRSAFEISNDLGGWAADWFICAALDLTRNQKYWDTVATMWSGKEKMYLLKNLGRINALPVSYYHADILEDCSPKVELLVDRLLTEKEAVDNDDSDGKPYSVLIFVEQRNSVLALARLLQAHPKTEKVFKIGTLIGASENSQRTSMLDITRGLSGDQTETLAMFRSGELNVVVATAVAEEGIDVQACRSVIRWAMPPNTASWLQSRGRARQRKSTFTVMIAQEDGGNDIRAFQEAERKMVELYNDTERDFVETDDMAEEDIGVKENDPTLINEETGAILTLQSVLTHLAHFCAIMPTSMFVKHGPFFDLDPPDLPEGWHSLPDKQVEPYAGPYGATVTLPRLLPSELRVFTTDCIHETKTRARQHAAFKAYSALYAAGLLTNHFLPITNFVEPHLKDTVQQLLAEVEKRASKASVTLQMDVWAATTDTNSGHWQSVLEVGGLPPLYFYTRAKLPTLQGLDAPLLYRPSRKPVKANIHSGQYVHLSDENLLRAQEYTRRLFFTLHGSRMKWQDLDFAYLVLPINQDTLWDSRRETKANSDDPLHANAFLFGREHQYPDDIAAVKNAIQFAKPFRFIRWRHEELSEEEMACVAAFYDRVDEEELKLAIEYPVIEAEALPPRANFLVPTSSNGPKARAERIVMLPSLSKVILLSSAEMEHTMLLPSILRSIAIKTTASALRETLFADSPSLSAIPIHLLTTAITASTAGEHENYQRLETLGDTVLKFTASINILAEYPLWHEGYLSRKKDHAVSNVRLAKEAVNKEVYKWIVRDRLVAKKWVPRHTTNTAAVSDSAAEKPQSEMLSAKVLADIVESLMGSAYIHGGIDLGVKCAQLFGMGLIWELIPARVKTLLSRVQDVDESMTLPSQLPAVEAMLGYTFKRKLLLVEALTHSSHHSDHDLHTISYERLEFLGDACIDMILSDKLYRAPGKNYTPGDMYHIKASTVNAHFLAYLCMSAHVNIDVSMPQVSKNGKIMMTPDTTQSIHLYQCMLHSSEIILEEQRAVAARYEKNACIAKMLSSGNIFPWVELTSLQAPKYLSDIVESLIGATYLDSGGNLQVVETVLRKLGFMPVLERIISENVDVLHPKSRLGLWIAKRHRKILYVFSDNDEQKVECTVLVDEEEIVRIKGDSRSKANKQEVAFRAAEMAIKILEKKEHEQADNDSDNDKKRKRTDVVLLRAGSPYKKQKQEEAEESDGLDEIEAESREMDMDVIEEHFRLVM